MTCTPVCDLLDADPFTPVVDVAGVADGELLAEIRAVEQFRNRLDAHQARLLGEVDARGTTDIVDGHRTKEWLVAKENLASAVAGARVTVARRLRTSLPETAAALREGRITFEHARVMVNAWNERNGADLEQMERYLIDEVRFVSFGRWKSEVAMVAATLDQDGSYDPDADLVRNVLSMAVVGDELVVKATLVGEARVVVEQTINRFADQIYRRLRADAEHTGDEVPNRRVLQAMALLEICRRANAVDLTATRPAEPEVRVIVQGDQLDTDAPHVADTEGRPVQNPGEPSNSILTLACAANLRAVILDSMGRPLDHGRLVRNFTPEQKAAMVDRDGGCTFPGCGRPVAWLDGHHVDHWVRDQGGTDVGRGVCLCRHHHRVVHRLGWGVELNSDGWAVFTRPAAPASGANATDDDEPIPSHPAVPDRRRGGSGGAPGSEPT